uniref:Zn-induced protein n=1 Tax=Oryza sativa TaxID=4530 RepID=Q40647_ORYSA|nr:Zn-induced protein [Oryza sativa]
MALALSTSAAAAACPAARALAARVTTTRGYAASAASSAMRRAAAAVEGKGAAGMTQAKDGSSSSAAREVSWVPDPVTGHYRPSNFAGGRRRRPPRRPPRPQLRPRVMRATSPSSDRRRRHPSIYICSASTTHHLSTAPRRTPLRLRVHLNDDDDASSPGGGSAGGGGGIPTVSLLRVGWMLCSCAGSSCTSHVTASRASLYYYCFCFLTFTVSPRTRV